MSDLLFIAMEYFELGDLEGFILTSGTCTEQGARTIAQQILEGLSVMHELGFTHRDLKPQVRPLDAIPFKLI